MKVQYKNILSIAFPLLMLENCQYKKRPAIKLTLYSCFEEGGLNIQKKNHLRPQKVGWMAVLPIRKNDRFLLKIEFVGHFQPF